MLIGRTKLLLFPRPIGYLHWYSSLFYCDLHMVWHDSYVLKWFSISLFKSIQSMLLRVLSFILSIPGCPSCRVWSHSFLIEERTKNPPWNGIQECYMAKSFLICQNGCSVIGSLLHCSAQLSISCCINICSIWSFLVACWISCTFTCILVEGLSHV